MQITQNSKPLGVLEFFSSVVEHASEFPGEVENISRNLNDDLIDFAQKLDKQKSDTAAHVEQELTQNKIRNFGSAAASWITANPLIALIIVAVIIFTARKV